ncbi:MAG: hypothetical protein NUV50_08425 [Rhodospirillales bacterium]|nr:hypothetical protein [Rhodospirillales bacterium]
MMGSFQDAVQMWSGAALKRREELCVNLRARSVKCEICREACPVSALELTEDHVAVSDACTVCGACVASCPGGVFSISGFSAEAVVSAVAGQTDVRMHCSESREIEGGGMVVPCLHVVDARMLAAMAGEGAESISFGGLDGCEKCTRGDARKAVADAKVRTERWLGAAAPAFHEGIFLAGDKGAVKVERHDQVKMDRRSFLRFAGVRAAVGAAGWLAPQVKEPDAPVSIFQRDPFAPRVVEYQQIVADRADRVSWNEKARPPFYSRTFEPSCTVCEVCAQRCPTGALHVENDATGKAISYDSMLCTNCTLCAVICPQEAVKARAFKVEDLTARERKELVRLDTVTCSQCRVQYVPNAETQAGLCSSCQIEGELDSEWMSMLGG